MKVTYSGPLGDGVTIDEVVFPPGVAVEVDDKLGKELAARPDFHKRAPSSPKGKPRSQRRSKPAAARPTSDQPPAAGANPDKES